MDLGKYTSLYNMYEVKNLPTLTFQVIFGSFQLTCAVEELCWK